MWLPCRFCTFTAIHDECYDTHPPTGAICIDDDVFCYKGYRFLGLGGSCRYRTGAWQFTEAEMRRRIRKARSKVMHAGGVDVLVTHAPLHGYGDLNDCRTAVLQSSVRCWDAYKPAVMLHGHVHLSYGANIPREHQYGATRIINCYERFDLELPDRPEIPARGLFARLRKRPIKPRRPPPAGKVWNENEEDRCFGRRHLGYCPGQAAV